MVDQRDRDWAHLVVGGRRQLPVRKAQIVGKKANT